MAMQATRNEAASLLDVVDRILDKGLVINADICVSVAGIELLGIKIRAAVASFETAAKYGLEFPGGTNLETPAWKQSIVAKEECPRCGKKVPALQLMEEECPWCGWTSIRAVRARGPAAELAGESA